MDQIPNQDQENPDQPTSEGKLTLKIVKFTKTFKEHAFFRSKPCYLHTLPWFMFITVEKRDNDLFLGFVIKCKSESNLWTCRASIELKIGDEISKEHSGTFCDEKHSWGISNFIAMSEILKKGLLVTDSLHLEATIKTDPPRGIINMIQSLTQANTEYQDKFAKLLENNLLTDIKFRFKDENGEFKFLKAHKFVLSLASDKFTEYFHENQESVVKIEDTMTHDCFKDILRFVYYKELELKGKPFDEILTLYSEFRNFGIADGVKYVQYYLQSNVGDLKILDVIGKLIITAKELNEKFLQQFAEALVIVNTKFIVCECDLTILSMELACTIFVIAFGKFEDQPTTCFDALQRYFEKSKLSKEMFSKAMEPAIDVIKWTEIGFENVLNANMLMDSTKLKVLQGFKKFFKNSSEQVPTDNLPEHDVVQKDSNKRLKLEMDDIKDLSEPVKSQDHANEISPKLKKLLTLSDALLNVIENYIESEENRQK